MSSYRQKTKQSTNQIITFSVNNNPNIKNCKYVPIPLNLYI